MTNYMARPGIQYPDAKLTLLKNFICEQMRVKSVDFECKKRTRNLVLARQIFFYLASKSGKMVAIGKYLGKHHSTVIHSRNQIENLLSYKSEESDLINDVIEKHKILFA